MILNRHQMRDIVLTALGKFPQPNVFRTLEEADRHRTGPDMRQTIILSDEVVKRQSPTLAQVEAEKARQGALIGERCGWFRSPHITTSATELGEIRFERLRNVVPLWSILRGHAEPADVLERVGRALAAIHNNMQLPEHMRSVTVPKWAADYPVVCLHGDFGVNNILVDSRARSVWIIDWMLPFKRTWLRVGTHGPCYYDLAVFISTMHTRRFFGLARIQKIAEKLDVFLRAYFEDSRHSCSADVLGEYLGRIFLPSIFHALFEDASRLRRIARPPLGRTYISRPALTRYTRTFTSR